MYVYGKAHLLYQSPSTCLTHVTTWLSVQVKCHYQDSMTSRWKTSKITSHIIMQQWKELKEPIPVPIRRYVYILRENWFYMTGNDPWHKPVPYTFLTTNLSSPSFPKLPSKVASPELIPGSPICFKKSMNVSTALFSNREKMSKICIKKGKIMRKLCVYMFWNFILCF